ncbi:MAG: hypothetical protein EXS05_17185 [Planctomycetaceae bacterium]|nr:hypothetical protein [Planctomycetaceae bacterium]
MIQKFPVHAAVAREYVRTFPDVRALRFKWIHACNLTGGEIDRVVVELESSVRAVLIEVRDDGAGLYARTMLDRKR